MFKSNIVSMRKIIILFLLITSYGLQGQDPDSSSALFTLREAERSFAKTSVMSGRQHAFAEFLAEKSVIYTDRWITNGKEFWSNRKPAPSVLKWEPEYITISSGRDFGISTGPWEAQEYRPLTKPLGTGYFLSVWEKLPGKGWAVILDAGISCPINGNLPTFTFPAGDDKDRNITPPKSSGTGPETAEKNMLDSWRKSPSVSTYNSWLSKNARLMRNGHLPSTNSDTINKWLAKMENTVVWRTDGSRIAPSGDMGFTYGYLENGQKISGTYVRIWRKNHEGNWKIIVESIN